VTIVNKEFWEGKRVLITGHTGFKGSWLSLWLQEMKANVFGFSLPPPKKPNLFYEARVSDNMVSIEGDIRNYEIVNRAILKTKPEVVIHMAAQPLVRYSYQNPIETYATNVMGTLNVLESLRKVSSVKAVINVTSDKCYENKEMTEPFNEEAPMGGYDPYSSSKGCSELLTNSFRRSFYEKSRIALASVRSGNVIGGGDWSDDRLIPDIIRAFEKNYTALIRFPNAIRPWQHVLEPLSGYLILAEKLFQKGQIYAGAWNFGPNDNDAKQVQWIVKHMAELWGKGATWKLDTNDHPHEANYLKLDCTKSKTYLDWSPSLNLEQALEMVVSWHDTFLKKKDIRTFTLKQIQSFNK
jgi:CDP-glucose 4,6-dehydratase